MPWFSIYFARFFWTFNFCTEFSANSNNCTFIKFPPLLPSIGWCCCCWPQSTITKLVSPLYSSSFCHYEQSLVRSCLAIMCRSGNLCNFTRRSFWIHWFLFFIAQIKHNWSPVCQSTIGKAQTQPANERMSASSKESFISEGWSRAQFMQK